MSTIYEAGEPEIASKPDIRLGMVDRASMTEQVLRELREAIIDGRIPQGAPLREVALAEMLGTGRTAVREAVRQLVQEGLVAHEAHRGAFVRELSLADRLDVFLAREAIECGATRRIIESSEPLDLSTLSDALDELRAAAAVGEDRVTEDLIAADLRFHQELVRLAGSERLTRAHDTLMAETQILLRHQPPYPGDVYVADHEVLLDAVERRDPRAPDLFAQHLRSSAQLIADELAPRSTDDEEGTPHEQ